MKTLIATAQDFAALQAQGILVQFPVQPMPTKVRYIYAPKMDHRGPDRKERKQKAPARRFFAEHVPVTSKSLDALKAGKDLERKR